MIIRVKVEPGVTVTRSAEFPKLQNFTSKQILVSDSGHPFSWVGIVSANYKPCRSSLGTINLQPEHISDNVAASGALSSLT